MKIPVAICALVAFANAQVGPSGIVSPDGNNIQFTHDFANDIAVSGPSGIVTKSGANLQLTHGQAALNINSPPAVPVSHFVNKNFGPSGIVKPDGQNIQFTHEQAHNFVVVGPSGAVSADGNHVQFRKKRSVDTHGHIIGDTGAILSDGQMVVFKSAAKPVVIGPSGIVLDNGEQFQLRPKRSKRSAVNEQGHLIGESGIVTKDGQQFQFAKAGVTVILEGPSGLLLSDGTQVQFKN